MDFETRQKLAIEEINTLLKKFGLGLKTFLKIEESGLTPQVRLVDAEPAQAVVAGEVVNETNGKTKKAKSTKK
jgi:hypothetical protein